MSGNDAARLREDEREALREVAEAATPGPWDLNVLRFGFWEVTAPTLNGEGDPRVFRFRVGDHMVERDAEHIATFDPPTALALLARLEAAEAARDEALAVVERVRAAVYWGRSDGWVWKRDLRAALTPSAPTEENA